MVESAQKFGKYRLIQRLATGGMAEVYEARVEGAGGFEKTVAIKRLHRRFSDDEEFASMLIDEAKLAVELNHPNIGQVYDLGETDGRYFLVMEYVDGMNLAELMAAADQRSRSVPMEAVVYMLVRVADALHYAHTKRGDDGQPLQLVHRDVSPQNIMLGREGEVKLVDFGIAKARISRGRTEEGVIKGKFRYMSPEQGHGNPVDARSDVYSMGMILYELLVGRHPYRDVSDTALIRRVRQADFPPLHQMRADLPDSLLALVDRALSRDKDHRFSTAREFATALERFADRYLHRFDRADLAELMRQMPRSKASEPQQEGIDSGDFASGDQSMIFEGDEKERTSPEMLSLQERKRQAGAGGDAIGRRKSGEATTDMGVGERFSAAVGQMGVGIRRRPHAIGASLVVIALLMFGISGWLLLADPEGEPREPTTAERLAERAAFLSGAGDAISITSVPANAEVFVDGESLGTTPVVVDDPGDDETRTVRLKKRGFAPEELTLGAESPGGDRAVRLRPLGAAVEVDADRRGIEVYLDGQPRGETPVVLMGLDRSAEYELEARSGDDSSQHRTISWGDDDPRVHSVAFEFGSRRVRSQPAGPPRESPSGADSQPSTPSEPTEPPPSQPDATDDSTASTSADEPPGEQQRESEEGEDGDFDIWQIGADEERGRLSVSTDAEEARIYVNGEMVKDGTGLTDHRLEPGVHDVQVYFSDDGSYSRPRRVEIRPGETSTVRIER